MRVHGMSNEMIWAGEFGKEYTDRNEMFPYASRHRFFKSILDDNIIKSVLEVGCNTGFNLGMMKTWIPSPHNVWGCDINDYNVQAVRQRWTDIQCCYASGFDLPFKDDYFDLVFTSGVLIHQKPTEVESMMQEIIRVSGKYVMAIEYFEEIFREIDYRGGKGTAFCGPYGDVYEKRYGLKPIASGLLEKDDGFDECTFWLFKKYA
jgi:pseudaminic acid biosynthesis-associated methylase